MNNVLQHKNNKIRMNRKGGCKPKLQTNQTKRNRLPNWIQLNSRKHRK